MQFHVLYITFRMLGVFVKGGIMRILWNWIIADSFSQPSISLQTAIVITFLIEFIRGYNPPKLTREEMEKELFVGEVVFPIIGASLVCIFVEIFLL